MSRSKGNMQDRWGDFVKHMHKYITNKHTYITNK